MTMAAYLTANFALYLTAGSLLIALMSLTNIIYYQLTQNSLLNVVRAVIAGIKDKKLKHRVTWAYEIPITYLRIYKYHRSVSRELAWMS
jgi:hypothetical protein